MQGFDVDTHREDPDVDELSPVGAGTAAKGALDLDTLWKSLEREDTADSLPKVTSVACGLEADEIG